MKRVLDLGCGTRKRPGAVGLDVNPRSDADIVHDLNVFPYPLGDSEFDEIYVDNVLEHLDNVVRVVEELHRIARPGALVKIIVPYFRSRWAYVDPTHRHFFTADSLSYFDPEREPFHRYDYSLARFRIEKRVFNESLNDGVLKGIVKSIANRRPGAYERFLAHLCPLDDLTFYLRVLK